MLNKELVIPELIQALFSLVAGLVCNGLSCAYIQFSFRKFGYSNRNNKGLTESQSIVKVNQIILFSE